ncbi:hypothetical protein [Ensifer aridi]|uniref:hypothetical protein n=1 Tax=Ensifer aridi TaxID=1708715 RepID=UPI000A10DDAC|nr:hypothetical protein [Ensifer aridi]
MTKKPDAVISALRDLAKYIETAGPAEATPAWNLPPLNASELARIATNLAKRLETVDPSKIPGEYDQRIWVSKIDLLKANTVPQFWNGNASVALPVYFQVIDWIDSDFSPLYSRHPDWEKLDDEKLIPKTMSKRLRSINARLERLDVDFSSLDEKIANINQAHQAANELPTDLEEIRAASKDVAENRDATEKNKVRAEDALARMQDLLATVEQHEKEARQLVANTADAYSAATTKGLGEAFQNRADRLANSMWVWVGGLLIALISGAVIGAHRIKLLQDLLLAENATGGKIAINLGLAFVTVAAPVWFAWIATKQIGHRFRLSEDYAFKASVAQAYEGYRREAARLDDAFAKRLFSSALDRIDEAPIRFVEHETPGSPWQEFFGRRARPTVAKRNDAQTPIQLPPAETTKSNGTAAVDNAAG